MFSRDLTVLPAHPHVHLQPERAVPAFAFPAISGTHLLTTDGWKAELAWVAGYIVRQFTCPKAVTHPTTSRAQCRATALIENNALGLPLQLPQLPAILDFRSLLPAFTLPSTVISFPLNKSPLSD